MRDQQIEAPMEHYRKIYRKLDPHTTSARTGVLFSGEFALRWLGKEVCVEYPEFRAVYADGGKPLSDTEQMLLIRYLLEGALAESQGFVSYSEIPWGDVYLMNFKGRCITRLAYGFGFDLERFRKAAASLGGVPGRDGDASADIELLDGFTIRAIIWAADDEFAPSAQMLFSDNFPMAFTAEDIAAIGDVLISALKQV